MRQREFIKGIAGSTTVWPLVARAQHGRPPMSGCIIATGAPGKANIEISVNARMSCLQCSSSSASLRLTEANRTNCVRGQVGAKFAIDRMGEFARSCGGRSRRPYAGNDP